MVNITVNSALEDTWYLEELGTPEALRLALPFQGTLVLCSFMPCLPQATDTRTTRHTTRLGRPRAVRAKTKT